MMQFVPVSFYSAQSVEDWGWACSETEDKAIAGPLDTIAAPCGFLEVSALQSRLPAERSARHEISQQMFYLPTST